MKLVLLDDERSLKDITWIKYPEGIWFVDVVRTYWEFKQQVEGMARLGVLNDYIFSFDHDIQCFDPVTNKEYTGAHCLDVLCYICYEDKLPLPICYFHSMNPFGRKAMEETYGVWKLRLQYT